MVGARQLGCDQQKDQVHGNAVERLEIDRSLKAGEDAEDSFRFGELAVRDGDAAAEPGRPEPFALQQGIENFTRRRPETVAARSLSSCNACFFVFTLSEGRIASGVTRSVSGIFSLHPWFGAAARQKACPAPAGHWRCCALGNCQQ